MQPESSHCVKEGKKCTNFSFNHFIMKHHLLLLAIVLSPVIVEAQVDLDSNLSDAEKLTGLSIFWSEAKYNFAFFDQTDVNWDSAYHAFIPQILETKNTWEYYLKMKEFCALLNDGHTDVYSPRGIFKSTIYTPLRFSRTGRTYFVSNVMLRDREKLPLGSVLVAIEGMDPNEWLEQHIYKYVSASTEHERMNEAIRSIYYIMPDTTHSLGMKFKAPGGNEIEYVYRFQSSRKGWVKEPEPRQRYHFEMKGEFAYVQLNTFGIDSVVYDFRRDLPRIRHAKGVIIDLRNNTGGSTGNGDQILMHFTAADTLVGSAWKTRQHQAAYKAWGTYYRRNNPNVSASSEDLSDFWRKSLLITEGDYWYEGGIHKAANTTERELRDMPLVVLTGNTTASAAEDFLVTLRQLPDRDIPVVGQTSFGSTGQPLPLQLPGEMGARICTKRDTFVDGTDFVGYGIAPDIEIIPAIEDVIQDRDVVLAKALDLLKQEAR